MLDRGNSGNQIELHGENLRGFETLRRLTNDIDRSERMPRVIDQGDKDPFKLLEVQDTYEYLAEDVFMACEGIAKAHLEAVPQKRKDFIKNGRVVMPEVTISRFHAYQLFRDTDEDGSTIFTFTRPGKGYEKSGFSVIRNENGHTVLRSFEVGDTNIQDDEEYLTHITFARRYVHEYAGKLNIPIESLEGYANREIKIQKLRQKIGNRALANVQAVTSKLPRPKAPKPIKLAQNLYSREVPVRYGSLDPKREFAPLRLALLALALPTPFYGTDLLEQVPVPKPAIIELADDILNGSEHGRQGKDARGYHLPENAQLINVGEEERLRDTKIAPISVRKQLRGAVSMKANDPSVQDAYGGPRRLTGLGIGDEGYTSTALPPKSCEDISVRLDVEDAIRIRDIEGTQGYQLNVRVDDNMIRVCNDSDQPVSEMRIDNIILEVIDRKA